MVVDNPVFHGLREAIIAGAANRRLPTVDGDPEFIDLGGLLYYGTDVADSCRPAARRQGDRTILQPARATRRVRLTAGVEGRSGMRVWRSFCSRTLGALISTSAR